MIRIAICDDEKKILDEVTDYINSYAEMKNDRHLEVFRFSSAKMLISALEDRKSFDIFILDVYIGDEIGTSLANNIRKMGIESPIIFATTSIEHAPESFESGTLRYLIKPIVPLKFYEAMDAAIIQVKRIEEHFLKFKTENGVESVNASHIMCSESHDHYQYVTLSGGEIIKVRMTVSELYALLAKHGGFIRVGSSYIVNLRHVKTLTRSEVLLYNNITVQIPRGKYTEIKNTFWNYQCEGRED